jgi:N-acetylglutamate synthase-like GNAT family acetyltransferase
MTEPSIDVRLATAADLPKIHDLIRESFDALNDHVAGLEDLFRRQAAEFIENGDLTPTAFEREYLSTPERTAFWVAVHPELGVIGCTGLKRLNEEDAELVRMAVTSKLRSAGLGARLVEELLAFAERSGAKRVLVVTGNPASARFYARMGFVSTGPDRVITVEGNEIRVWSAAISVAPRAASNR